MRRFACSALLFAACAAESAPGLDATAALTMAAPCRNGSICDAVTQDGSTACHRRARCGEPGLDVDACIASFVAAQCAVRDCGAPFGDWQAWQTFEGCEVDDRTMACDVSPPSCWP